MQNEDNNELLSMLNKVEALIEKMKAAKRKISTDLDTLSELENEVSRNLEKNICTDMDELSKMNIEANRLMDEIRKKYSGMFISEKACR